MKNIRKIICFMLTAMLVSTFLAAFSVSAESLPDALRDGAGLLSYDEAQTISTILDTIREQYSIDISIITSDDGFSDYAEPGTDIERIAGIIYETDGYGCGEYHDGMLLVLDMENRNYYMKMRGYPDDEYDYQILDDIENRTVSYLRENDYYNAFYAYALTNAQYIGMIESGEYYADDDYRGGEQQEGGMGAISALMLGGIPGLIAFISTKSKESHSKTASNNNYASNYIKNQPEYTVNKDVFAYSNVVRTPRQQPQSSSGGRSGGHMSGGGHGTHSGGRGGSF